MEPVGPLPPAVYWRRRAIAIAAVALVLVLFGWGLSALTGGGEEPAPTAASGPTDGPRPAALASAAPDGEGQGATPGPVAAPTSGPIFPPTGPIFPPTGPIFPTSGAPAVPGAVDRPAPSVPTPTAPLGAPGADAALSVPPGGDSLRLRPGPTSPPVPMSAATLAAPLPITTPTPRAAPVPPPPGRCADGALRVTARTDKPRYAPGERPTLSLVVTNTGRTACVRDLDAARQAVAVVRKPGDGLWGSNDCAPGRTDDVRTLAPGQEAVFAVRWSGRTSAPKCAGPRDPVPPGAYQLLARLDGIISAPVPFALS